MHRKLPSFVFSGDQKQVRFKVIKPKIQEAPKEAELCKILQKYTEMNDRLQDIDSRQNNIEEIVREMKKNIDALIEKQDQMPCTQIACAVPQEAKPKPEVKIKELSRIEEKISRTKRTFFKMPPEQIASVREKFPLFPPEYESKLFTTDTSDAYVEFRNRKLELNGATLLKLLANK